MSDFIGPLISAIIPVIIVIFCTLYLAKMFRDLTKGLGPKPKKFSPQDIGDRLKKYIILAARSNPNKSKIIKIKRTKYNEGGVFGYVSGVVTDGNVTRFVFKRFRYIGFRQVLYCPVGMHSSLHYKEVFIDAISIENVSGFYFAIPNKRSNFEVYNISFNAFKKDLKKMQRMDTQQVEVEQILSAMIGDEARSEIITDDDELPMTEVSDETYA